MQNISVSQCRILSAPGQQCKLSSADKTITKQFPRTLDLDAEPSLRWIDRTKMNTSEQTGNFDRKDLQIRVEINPWPLLWTVVGAWMWFGLLHLAHIV